MALRRQQRDHLSAASPADADVGLVLGDLGSALGVVREPALAQQGVARHEERTAEVLEQAVEERAVRTDPAGEAAAPAAAQRQADEVGDGRPLRRRCRLR